MVVNIGSKTKEAPKLSDPIDREQNSRPKEYGLGFRFSV